MQRDSRVKNLLRRAKQRLAFEAMRFFLLILFVVSLTLLPTRGVDPTPPPDPNEKFYEMFTLGVYKAGRLDVFIWEFSNTWLNGVHQSDEDDEFQLKPGDIMESFVCGDHDRVLRYRLDRLTPKRADFTRWIYTSIKSRNPAGLWEYRPGPLQLSDTFTLDLTQLNGLLVDYGPNYVVSSGQKTPRSK